MDDRDLHVIAAHVSGIFKLIEELDIASSIRALGKVEMGRFEIVLTAAQKTAIKTKFDAIAVKITATVGTLDSPTGKVGVADPNVLQKVQQSAKEGEPYINSQLDVFRTALQSRTEFQPDGSLGLEFNDNQAQEVANIAKTLGEVFKILLAILRTRFP